MSAWSEAERAGHIAHATLTDKPLRLRTVRCACGGEITADVADPVDAVLRHNRTRAHILWWYRTEMDWQGDE